MSAPYTQRIGKRLRLKFLSRMRDPSILRDPDGMFHPVWTVSWTDHAIGVAHSGDLIH